MYINDQNTWDELLQSDQYPAYSTVDLKFWKPVSRHYHLSLGVQNLFDVKIYDSKYNVGPGRFITAGIEVRL
jgi:outer membrane receptor protein involved in Fe transport